MTEHTRFLFGLLIRLLESFIGANVISVDSPRITRGKTRIPKWYVLNTTLLPVKSHIWDSLPLWSSLFDNVGVLFYDRWVLLYYFSHPASIPQSIHLVVVIVSVGITFWILLAIVWPSYQDLRRPLLDSLQMWLLMLAFLGLLLALVRA